MLNANGSGKRKGLGGCHFFVSLRMPLAHLSAGIRPFGVLYGILLHSMASGVIALVSLSGLLLCRISLCGLASAYYSEGCFRCVNDIVAALFRAGNGQSGR